MGNGIQDDTAAVQSAIELNINESESVCNKKTIYFPDGTYRLTGLSGNIRASSNADSLENGAVV